MVAWCRGVSRGRHELKNRRHNSPFGQIFPQRPRTPEPADRAGSGNLDRRIGAAADAAKPFSYAKAGAKAPHAAASALLSSAAASREHTKTWITGQGALRGTRIPVRPWNRVSKRACASTQ